MVQCSNQEPFGFCGMTLGRNHTKSKIYMPRQVNDENLAFPHKPNEDDDFVASSPPCY